MKAKKKRAGKRVALNTRLSVPSRSVIIRRLKELRTLIDTTGDPYAARIAYAMETSIRWATERTYKWSTPAKNAVKFAEMLRTDLINQKLASYR